MVFELFFNCETVQLKNFTEPTLSINEITIAFV